MFKLSNYNITNFNKISDYIPILAAVLFVDMTGIYMCYTGWIKSKFLTKWYQKYGLSAVIADVLVIFLGIVITRYVYTYFFKSYNLLIFVLIALVIQVIHDMSFYLFVKWIPLGTNSMLDLFKEYTKDSSVSALWGDSIMLVCSILIATFYSGFSLNTNIINLVFTLYFLPYILYMR